MLLEEGSAELRSPGERCPRHCTLFAWPGVTVSPSGPCLGTHERWAVCVVMTTFRGAVQVLPGGLWRVGFVRQLSPQITAVAAPLQGPCRREMEDTLNHLKFLNMLSPRGIHIPNCDRKGFYKKKQVSASPRVPVPPQPRPPLTVPLTPGLPYSDRL